MLHRPARASPKNCRKQLLVRVLAVLSCVVVPVDLRAAAPTTHPGGIQELPEFGVFLPPSPEGFEKIAELDYGMFSSQIAGWQHRRPDGREERIILSWFHMPMLSFSQKARRDLFRGAAEDGLNDDAKEISVPHSTVWPTLRFERKAGAYTPGDLVRKETVAANNVAYALMHYAPGGESAEVRAAFDSIAAGLEFAPPATLGESLRPGQRRVRVLGKQGVTVALPEPFRALGPEDSAANAFDLTFFTRRGKQEIDGASGDIHFEIGGREIPKSFVKPRGISRLPSPPSGWVRDDAELRIAQPVQWKKIKEVVVGFVGGRKLDGDRWLWIVLILPQAVVDEAHGAATITKLLEETLRTAEAATPG